MAVKKSVRDRLLVEAQHRCTICSERCFEIHHMVEKSDGGSDDEGNLIVICPNCHQHRYHRCGEFTREQLLQYKERLKERVEVEKRLLQNLEELRSEITQKNSSELREKLVRELLDAKAVIDPARSPVLAKSIEETTFQMAEESVLPDAARQAIEIEYEIEREALKSQFPEIRVLGADESAYRKHNKFPRAYEFVLLLGREPHRDWISVFDREYQQSWYNMKREMRIAGDRVFLIVADSDNLQRHVDWVKDLVEKTNTWVRERGFTEIDVQVNRAKAEALEKFDAIYSMKERTRDLRF
jgi:hypothetical protein